MTTKVANELMAHRRSVLTGTKPARKCKRCGHDLPADYRPIHAGALRLIICSECMIDLAVKNTPVADLWQYNGVAEPKPQPEPSLPGVPVALAMFAGCCAAIVLAGFLIGYLAGGL